MNFSNLILAMLLCCSCISTPSNQKISALTTKDFLSFKLGSTESEMIRLLGPPSAREESNNQYILAYKDPKTGQHRLSLNFLKKDQKLWGCLWIPDGGEPEIRIESAKALFKGAKFKEILRPSKAHHFSDERSYIDEISGVSILYNGSYDAVDGIARYEPAPRSPANEIRE